MRKSDAWPGLALLALACTDSGEGTTRAPVPEGGATPMESPAQVQGDPSLAAEAGEPPYRFRDVTASSGLGAFEQVCGDSEKPFIVETIGGGVALFDCDGDGDLDVYLTNGSRFGGFPEGEEARDALFLNDGAAHFTDATSAAGLGDAGWSTGVRVADFDGDQRPDLYITNYGANVLYRNLGGGRFEDVTERAGVGHTGWSTGACFLDFDKDGDLDLYVANYIDFEEERMLADKPRAEYKGVLVMKGPRGLQPAQDTFYINNGDGTFRDATHELGIDAGAWFGFQCVAFDIDQDGWVDIYVANDSVKNVLWRNNEGQGFTDGGFFAGVALSKSGEPQAGMGVGLGDFDGDLLMDIFVTNFADDYFTLYRGNRAGSFIDTTKRMRLVEPTKALLGWGCGFEDFDSDGDLEIYVATGHVYPQVDQFELSSGYRQRNLLIELQDGVFQKPLGGIVPGFELESSSRGAAVGDVDGDGDMDLLFGNLDEPPTLLLNSGPNQNWIKVLSIGAGLNTEAVGARIIASVGERRHLRLVGTAQGFLSSSDPRLHIGLGDASEAESVEIHWPSGASETFGPVPAGTLVILREGQGEEGRTGVEFVNLAGA